MAFMMAAATVTQDGVTQYRSLVLFVTTLGSTKRATRGKKEERKKERRRNSYEMSQETSLRVLFVRLLIKNAIIRLSLL